MSAPQSTPQLATQLLEWTKAEQLGQVEECWMERLAHLPNQAAFYKEWLKAMRRAGAGERAESLLALLVDDRLTGRKLKAALRILLAAVPFYPQSPQLRPQLVQTMRAFYHEIGQCDELLKLTGLEGARPLPEAFQAFQEWIKLTPGQVYQHYDWGEGIIQTLDIEAGKVTLAFANDPAKVMTVDGVRKYLKYIEPGHYLALRAKDPDQVRRLAEQEPVELVKLVLASQSEHQLKQAELKALITPSVIAPEQWNSWWSKAREGLKLDPFIDFDASGGAHSLLQLRDQPRTFEQEIEERFFAEDAGTALRVELIRQLAKRPKEVALPITLIRRMAERLQQDWSLADETNPVARLEIAYMLGDLAALAPECAVKTPPDTPLLAAIDDYTVLCDIDHVDYGIRALKRLLERDGEAGCRQAAALLPAAPVKLAQAIWTALDEEHHLDLAVGALQRLFNAPLENPDTYAWAVRATVDGSWPQIEEVYPASSVVPDLLDQMDLWQRLATEPGTPAERVAAAKTLLSRIRTMLGAGKAEAFARTVRTMPRESIMRLRHQIQVHGALPGALKEQAERTIRITRRDLDEGQLTRAREEEELLCTARAYTEKAQELRLITSEKIPHNSRVIEEARMEGDLRENAGYQYAKEEQKMLVQQQASLTEQLSRARIIRTEQIDTTTVGFGTRLRAFNQTAGREEVYTLLGRWEANPEKQILSLQAPLAQQFSGHKAGDAVTIKHPGGGQSEYKILAIENALAGGEWDAEV